MRAAVRVLTAGALLCATVAGAAVAAETFAHAPAAQRGPAPGGGEDHGIATENLFGFTRGSDQGEAGEMGMAFETLGRFGKRLGTYRALGQKLEAGVAVTNDLGVAVSVLGACHRVRNIPGFDDVPGRCGFNGLGGELRLRFLDRSHGPFGMTLQIEPSVARFDEGSGQVGFKIGSENKLIFDRELVPEKLFGAVNLLYDLERFRERRSGEVERGSQAGVSAALAYQVAPRLFVGAEVRYLRAYEGLALERYKGDAVYVGPTLFARITPKLSLSAAWNVQVSGRERLDRAGLAEALEAEDFLAAAAIARPRKLNLSDFERHRVGAKLSLEF